jgi:hypothetical protein
VLRAFVIAPLVVASACGDNARPDEAMRSGDRLRLIAYEFADGTRSFDQRVFHDRERREDCTIELFSSGERYCMPVTAGGTTVFTEDSCTRAIGATPAGEPPEYFVRSFLLHGTSLPSRLYRAAAPTDEPMFVWEQRDEFCLGPLPAPAQHSFFLLGEEITTAELVRVRELHTATEGRLTIGIDETDDGWRMPGALTDEVSGPCELLPSANAATAPCLPAERATQFADATCTQALARAELAAHRDVDSGCWSLLEPGEPFAGQAYERIGETCVAIGTSEPLFSAEATLEVAALARTPIVQTRRLLSIELGSLTRDTFLHDTVLAADCEVIAAEDGYACVPHAALQPLPFFDDAACIVPIEVAFVPTGACEAPSLFAGRQRIGARRAAPIYELTTGDRCAAYAPPARFAIHDVEAVETTDVVPAVRVLD